MTVRKGAALAACMMLIVAACSSSASSPGPGGSAAASTSAKCAETTDAGKVNVTIVDFGFQPSLISAKVGEVIAFTNTGSAPHTATIGPSTCTTPALTSGKSDGLVFSVPGQYPLACTIHPQMTATVEISS